MTHDPFEVHKDQLNKHFNKMLKDQESEITRECYHHDEQAVAESNLAQEIDSSVLYKTHLVGE
jgi:predicted thioredoxin/glutaredoxin